jgi:hypothetical protein
LVRVEGAMSYREISSAQILLPEHETVHFAREVRSARLRWVVDVLERIGDFVLRPRRGQPWPAQAASTAPDLRVVALALVAVSLGVALCYVLATSSPPAPLGITASPIAAGPVSTPSLPPPRSVVPARERVIDSEPHGATVHRMGVLIGTTPFLYDTPDGSPLGEIELRLDGFRPERRFADHTTPRVLVVPLRRR